MIGLRLPPDTTARVDAFAVGLGVSRSEAIRRLIEIGLDHSADGDPEQPATKVPAITHDRDTI
jgi:predicted DNA-binding protein